MKTIATQQQISDTILKLAGEIRSHYPDEPPTLVVLLEGARRFSLQLLEHLPPDTPVCYLRASSYHGKRHSSGKVIVNEETPLSIEGKQVLLIDDIYDTGRTIHAVSSYLRTFNPRSLKTCVLIIKKRQHEQPIPIDFSGMHVEDLFLVGFGLDYQERFRDMDEIVAVEGETLQQLINLLESGKDSN